MTGKEILYALEYVNEEHILRAAPTGRIARRVWVRWASLAACLCLCVGTALGVMLRHEPAPVGEGITIPQSQVNLKKPTDGMYDMPGLFIYNGRVYRHFQNIDGLTLRGRYLATVTGLIDEWTKEDGYVELAGTTPGEIYTVKGYDPDFMLCQAESDGVSIFTCLEGLTVYTGEDWFGDIYRLRRELDTVVCEQAVCRNQGYRRPMEMGEEHEGLLRRLVDALYASPLMHTADVPWEGQYSNSLNENSLYVMEMTLENGITLTVQLWRGGYLTHGAVAVKLDNTLYEELLTVLGETCGTPWYLESGDIFDCTGEDVLVGLMNVSGNLTDAEVSTALPPNGRHTPYISMGEAGIEAVYDLIDTLCLLSPMHEDVMCTQNGWENPSYDGKWYRVVCPIADGNEVRITLYEGGWVTVGVYPLTFYAEGETFDALWTLCGRLTAD